MSVANAFDEALSRFKKELTDKEIANFTATSIQDCWIEAEKIQSSQAARRSLRCMRRIEPYLNALTQFSGVVEVFVQAKPEIMSFVWGPIKFLIQVASTYTKSLDKLLDAFVKISESLPRFVNYADIFQKNPRMTHVVSLIYEDILIFHQSTMKFFKMRAWQQIFTHLWKTFEDSFGTILENLDRHKALVDSEATAAHIAAADAERKAAIRANEQNQKDRHIRHMRELKEWLAPVSYETQQTDFAYTRKSCSGTGGWLLQHDKFKAWLDPMSQVLFLWLTGIPGSGKTILASLVIDHTKLISQGKSSTIFALLKSGNRERNSCLTIMRTLVYQLLVQNRDLIHYIYQDYESSNFNPPTSQEQIEDFLQTMLWNITVPYIIIDGLDEVEPIEGKNLLSSLVSIQSKNPSLKIFLSSRSEVDISRILSSVPHDQIKIGEANMKDIVTYAQVEGRQLIEKFTNLDPETREEIERMVQRVGDCAHGMFLWVRLVIYNLMQQTNLEELEVAVQDLPKGLEEAYGRILKRIDGQLGPVERDCARRILEWVVCANQPLKLKEIGLALSIRVGDRNFVKKRKFLRRPDELCGPILEIHDNDIVDFVHFSAKEYLTSQYSGPFIHAPTAHFNIAQTCLSYLLFACFDPTIDDDKIVDCIYNGDYRLEDYVEHNWLNHVKHANDCSAEQLSDLSSILKSFIQYQRSPGHQCSLANRNISHFSNFHDKHPDIYTNLVAIYNYESRNSQENSLPDFDVDKHPLQLQSVIGRVREKFETLVLSLPGPAGSEGEKHLQSIRGLYGSNLFKCRQRGCIQFHSGFETPEDRDKHARKHIRSFKCRVRTCPSHSIGFVTEQALERHHNDHHKEMVSFDIIDPSNIPIKVSEIAEDPKALSLMLKDSINTDNVALLNFVLAQGVDIEGAKIRGSSIFGYALSRGSKSTNTVHALIERRANIRTVTNNRRMQSALLIASQSQFYDINTVQLLVEKGGAKDLLEEDNHGKTPLMYALLNRSYVGVESFLATVDKAQMNTTLGQAWCKRIWEVAKSSLDYGATTLPAIAGNALLTAIEERLGLEDLEAILNHGTDAVNLAKALTTAWDNRQWDSAHLLLQNGARATPISGGNALLAAVGEGQKPEDLVAILNHGTDTDNREKALAMAKNNGLLNIEQFLLRSFTDSNTLLSAVRDGREVEELRAILDGIGNGPADLTAALTMAWHNRHWDSAQFLLQCGARTTPIVAGNALLATVGERRDLEEIKEILKHGTDMDNRSKALAEAWDNGLWDVGRFLVQCGARTMRIAADNALLAAVGEGRDLEEIKEILNHGTDADSQANALAAAWDNGFWDVGQLLLQYGARTTRIAASNVLLAAVERQDLEELKVLKYGTDADN